MLNPKRFLFNVLLATSCLTTVTYASSQQLNLNIDEDSSQVRVHATLNDQTFNHTLERDGITQSNHSESDLLQIQNDGRVVTYKLYNHPLFRINLQQSSLDILANIQDLYLALKTNMSVTLSENKQQTRLAGATLISTADIFNRGELFVGARGFQGSGRTLTNGGGGIVCVGSPFEFEALNNGEFSNEFGTIKASTISITATAINNTQGVLCASKEKTPGALSPKTYPLCVATGGVSLVAKRLIDNRSGLVSDTWTPYVLLANPLPSKRRTGFDNRSGTVVGRQVRFNHNGWPFLFHNATVHSDSDVNADVAELTSDDESFKITARGSIQLRAHEFKGQPKLTALNIEFNIPFHKDVPVLTFGKNTQVETRIFKLTTLDEFYPKVSLSGNLTADLFEVGVDASGDMHCKVDCIDLRSPKGALALRSTRNDVSKVNAKVSDLEALKDLQKIAHIYVYVKPNTDVLQFRSLHLPTTKLSIIQLTGEGNLFVSGSVRAPEINVVSARKVEDGAKISGFEERLLLESEKFLLRAPGALLRHGDLQVYDLDLMTYKTPVELNGSIKRVAVITVDGAGLILSQALAFETLKARGALLVLSKDIKVDRLDATIGTLVVASSGDVRIKVEAKEDASISFERGQVINAELKVSDGKLEVNVGENLELKPGYTRTNESETPVPSVMHGAESLTINLASKAELMNESGVLSSDHEVRHTLGEGAKVQHYCTHETKVTHDEKKREDLTFIEKYMKGDGGHHTVTVKKTPVAVQIKAPHVIFAGGGNGHLALEGAEVNSSVLSVNVHTLEQKPAIATKEKSGQIVIGRLLWSSLKEISSEESTPILTKLTATTQEIEAVVRSEENGERTYKYKEKHINRTLAPVSHVAIAATTAILTQHFGVASMVLNRIGAGGASHFVTCATSGLLSGGARQVTAAGISWVIGDKNYLDYVASQRVATDLIVSSLIAGVLGELGSVIMGDSYVPYGAQKLPHFFSVTDKTININVSNLMKHLGLLTANAAGDMVTITASGAEISWEDFLFALFRHEVSSLAAHGATHIGDKYDRGDLTYWQHKGMHFRLGAVAHLIKAAPELYWKQDKHAVEKLLAGMLGAGLGASVAEITAEYMISPKIMSTNQNLEGQIQRAALFGKLSSILVGLGCMNEISLASSYEAGCRAIDHNFLMVLIPLISGAIEACEIYVSCQNVVEIVEFIKVVCTGDPEAVKDASINLVANLAQRYATNKGVQYAGAKLIKLLESPLARNYFAKIYSKTQGKFLKSSYSQKPKTPKISSKSSGFKRKKVLRDREELALKDKNLLGENSGNVRTIDGKLRADTEKVGGVTQAKEDYFKMTGERVGNNKTIQQYTCADGKVITFRLEGKSGHPKIDINDPVQKLIEKVTYK